MEAKNLEQFHHLTTTRLHELLVDDEIVRGSPLPFRELRLQTPMNALPVEVLLQIVSLLSLAEIAMVERLSRFFKRLVVENQHRLPRFAWRVTVTINDGIVELRKGANCLSNLFVDLRAHDAELNFSEQTYLEDGIRFEPAEEPWNTTDRRRRRRPHWNCFFRNDRASALKALLNNLTRFIDASMVTVKELEHDNLMAVVTRNINGIKDFTIFISHQQPANPEKILEALSHLEPRKLCLRFMVAHDDIPKPFFQSPLIRELRNLHACCNYYEVDNATLAQLRAENMDLSLPNVTLDGVACILRQAMNMERKLKRACIRFAVAVDYSWETIAFCLKSSIPSSCSWISCDYHNVEGRLWNVSLKQPDDTTKLFSILIERHDVGIEGDLFLWFADFKCIA